MDKLSSLKSHVLFARATMFFQPNQATSTPSSIKMDPVSKFEDLNLGEEFDEIEFELAR